VTLVGKLASTQGLNTIPYNTAVNACEKVGSWVQAWRLWQEGRMATVCLGSNTVANSRAAVSPVN